MKDCRPGRTCHKNILNFYYLCLFIILNSQNVYTLSYTPHMHVTTYNLFLKILLKEGSVKAGDLILGHEWSLLCPLKPLFHHWCMSPSPQ